MTAKDTNSAHKKLCQKIHSEGIEVAINIADEPSVALYRIQENIRKIAPRITEERKKALVFSEKLQDATFDLENSLDALSAFPKAQANLENALKILDSCLLLHQSILADAQTRKYNPEIETGVDVVALLDDII